MINLGLIGCGYWGPNLLRSFMDNSSCQVAMVCDLDSIRLGYIHQKYPALQTTQDYYDLLTPAIDAVVIATQPSNHYQLAKEALQKGKHVLVEKPLAMTSIQAEELTRLAARNRVKLMVGHTFEYNAAVQELKKQIQNKNLGDVYYIYAQRLNFGIVRKDINALWSLAPHDISILIHCLEAMPTHVSARGFDFIQKGVEDVVFLNLYFPGNVIAHIQVSWLDAHKVRRMTVVGSNKTIIYDDVADAKIQIYDKGINKENINDSLGMYDDFGRFQLLKSAGNVIFPKINFTEPLRAECSHFIDCIRDGREPLSNGANGWRVVKVLEAAQESLRQDGKQIEIKVNFADQNNSLTPAVSS